MRYGFTVSLAGHVILLLLSLFGLPDLTRQEVVGGVVPVEVVFVDKVKLANESISAAKPIPKPTKPVKPIPKSVKPIPKPVKPIPKPVKSVKPIPKPVKSVKPIPKPVKSGVAPLKKMSERALDVTRPDKAIKKAKTVKSDQAKDNSNKDASDDPITGLIGDLGQPQTGSTPGSTPGSIPDPIQSAPEQKPPPLRPIPKPGDIGAKQDKADLVGSALPNKALQTYLQSNTPQLPLPPPEEVLIAKRNASSNQTSSTGSSALTLDEITAFKGQIARCWTPLRIDGDGAIIVKIQIVLTTGGQLVGEPEILNSSPEPQFQAAADSAVRALKLCAPYLLPSRKYRAWQKLILNFDPKEILPGG